MYKMVAIATIAIVLLVGCTGQSEAPEGEQENNQVPKTVVVNEGMSKEEEDELNERIADLEDKVNDQPDGQTTQETESSEQAEEADETADAEGAARAATEAYYAAAASGNYSYTYNELSSYARSQFTEDEWVAANTSLGSDAASYSLDSVEMLDGSTAETSITISQPDGSSSGRVTRFILENGSWKHELTQDEYDLFAGASDTAASASPSASATADPSDSGDTKLVTVVISSDKPADVSIYDDNFDWAVNEEIVGTKTYEREIAQDSGLSVSAITAAYRAQTSIEVYEDGTLVTQDSDSNGNAIVTY